SSGLRRASPPHPRRESGRRPVFSAFPPPLDPRRGRGTQAVAGARGGAPGKLQPLTATSSLPIRTGFPVMPAEPFRGPPVSGREASKTGEAAPRPYMPASPPNEGWPVRPPRDSAPTPTCKGEPPARPLRHGLTGAQRSQVRPPLVRHHEGDLLARLHGAH